MDDPFAPWNWEVQREAFEVALSERDDSIRALVSPEDWDYVKTVWMHRDIAMRAFGPPPTKRHVVVDHINGVRLDNRRGNLRWATLSENNTNRQGYRIVRERQRDLFDVEASKS